MLELVIFKFLIDSWQRFSAGHYTACQSIHSQNSWSHGDADCVDIEYYIVKGTKVNGTKVY